MKVVLNKFKVQNFRSIEDSGWVDAERITCLVGTNESGKTNLLLALWKLKPANNEPIEPLIDYPRKKYHTYASTQGNEVFVTAHFHVDEETTNEFAKITGWPRSIFRELVVSRKYNGSYIFQLPQNKLAKLEGDFVTNTLSKILSSLEDFTSAEEEDLNQFRAIRSKIEADKSNITSAMYLDRQELTDLRKGIETILHGKGEVVRTFTSNHIMPMLDKMLLALDIKGVSLTKEYEDQVLAKLPTFVYYSDYGNLDSEIYLPHVIENFKRSDLGEKERAKSRSLKVLFEFVKLSPDQISELGKEALPVRVEEYTQYQHSGRQKTGERIEQATHVDIEEQNKKKKERGILLQAASTSLTKNFAAWWKQGKYVFDFQADGNHFRIWVSDNKRPERIELEGRSKGLQWFFSFFLVFLVESKDSHSNCILLLDEPGISLHPVAQMDLIAFFDSLSNENQLLYTTHSPFLVNPNNLSGVHAMYVGEGGESVLSTDLRANVKIAEKSIYPIHAAIGITVSDTLLIGCQPVLVEGVSDQIYLQQIKKYVLAQGKYKNNREVVFIPTGGVKGMSPVIKILLGKDDKLPYVIMDSDKSGKDKIKQLESGLYKDEKEKVLSLSEFIGDDEYEIEDLMPSEELARLFAKQYRRVNSEDDFDFLYDNTKPIVDQMERYAVLNGHKLSEGWKVELAKEFQRNFDRIIVRCDDSIKERWVKVIERVTL